VSAHEHRRVERLIDRHFAGRIAPSEERALREHVAECDACCARYERHLLLARLDPRARPAEERLARGLGLPTPRRSRATTWIALGGLASSAALAALLAIGLRSGPPPGSFVGRGAPPTDELVVYRLRPGAGAEPARGAIAASDELAFAYRNHSGCKRLLVFAVDEHRHVYWYHPAWTDAQADPVAVPIEAGEAVHELPQAIVQPLDGKSLRVYGLFLDRAATVREVEAAVQAGRDGARLIGDASTTVTELTVRP
jgi:hypothetical protein